MPNDLTYQVCNTDSLVDRRVTMVAYSEMTIVLSGRILESAALETAPYLSKFVWYIFLDNFR